MKTDLSLQPPPADADAEFAWSDKFLLGYIPMDHTHREFVETVAAMHAAEDGAFGAALEAFIAHAQRHFGEEDEWMRQTDFPAAACHIDEHAAVMKSAHEVRQRVEAGDFATGRDFARELAKWFPGHADYLDSALAAWMVKRQHGGRPVVLRRSIG